MSHIRDHIRAQRSLAEAFAFEANECGDTRNALLLTRISAAYSRSAGWLEAEEDALRDLCPDCGTHHTGACPEGTFEAEGAERW